MTDRTKEEYFLEQLNDGIGFWVKSKARLAHAKSPFQDIEVLETDFSHVYSGRARKKVNAIYGQKYSSQRSSEGA